MQMIQALMSLCLYQRCLQSFGIKQGHIAATIAVLTGHDIAARSCIAPGHDIAAINLHAMQRIHLYSVKV